MPTHNSAIGETVHHPRHYNKHPAGIECIEVVEHMTFNIGTAVKYLWRADVASNDEPKSPDKRDEELRKAVWYVERERMRLGNIIERQLQKTCPGGCHEPGEGSGKGKAKSNRKRRR